MSEIVVFLGPSLALADARALLDADYRPPVAMGDVYRALRSNPRAIVIVDGLFEQTPSVWHKEILLALSRGVWVYGGASMGALRACELDPFGMIGVGSIYARFCEGLLEDDDEVAVSHADADSGWRPLSEAMVNLRDGLARARERGLLDAREHDALVARAKARFYPERSWPQTLDDARALGLTDERVAGLRELVRAEPPQTKAADARAVLARVAEDQRAGQLDRPHAPTFRLEHAAVMGTLLDETALPPDALAATPATRHRSSARSLGRMVRAVDPARDELYADCLYRMLLSVEGVRAGIYGDWIEGFEALTSLGEQLGDPEAEARVEAEVRRLERHLRAVFGARLDLFLPAALDRRGPRGPTLERLRGAWTEVHERGLFAPSPAELDLDPVALFEWYAARFGVLDPNPEAHARAIGLSLSELLLEAGAQYLLEHAPAAAPHQEDEEPPC